MIASKETFVPLYITNACDGQCSVCNMRKSNNKLKRIEIDKKKVIEQLRIIYNIEKISAICLLTGEYFTKEMRLENCKKVIEIMHIAFSIGFKKIFFNIGSLSEEEIQLFKTEFPNDRRIIISLFQETYDRECYEKNFGLIKEGNPKADFERRYSTVERFLKAGFYNCDIGFLVGINQNYNYEINQLIKHVEQLKVYNGDIYISLPRVCRSISNQKITSDSEYIEVIKRIKQQLPACKIVITTRENSRFIKEVINYIDVISPGSSDVLPYRENGKVKNDINTSQFVINKERQRPKEVLSEIGIKSIKYYEE